MFSLVMLPLLLPIFLPVLEYIALNKTSGLSSLVAELPSPVLQQALGGVGLQTSKQIQVISVQSRSLKTSVSSKTQHPSTHVRQHGPCAALLGRAKLCSKGEEAREGPGQEECSQSLH